MKRSGDERIAERERPEEDDARAAAAWMQKFARQTAPHIMPSPGILLFKARLREKRLAARRAMLPMIFMKAAAAFIGGLALAYLQTKKGLSVGPIIGQTMSSFAAILPLVVLALAGILAMCLVAARFLRDGKGRL